MSFATEFPDYDASTLPEIPTTWVDVSWRYDDSPSWRTDVVQVFIDHADPEKRELIGAPRFFVQPLKHDGGEPMFQSDDWAAVLEFVARIAP